MHGLYLLWWVQERHLSPVAVATILAAGDFALMSYHPLGTCRMGRDPKTSVVGLDHQAHDLPGFYVVDGSTVPTSLGVNPQLTIMAMAARAADGIADALG